jgi:bacterial/archaeal transporter family-2 protein
MEPLLIMIALALGGLLAVQAAANVQLAGAMGSPMGASTAQLALGTGVLVAVAAALGSLGTVELIPDVATWHLIGGLASALYISAGVLLLPRLGALSAIGLFIAGQMLASLAVDGFGWLGTTAQPLGVPGVIGGLAVLVGAALIIRTGATAAALAGRPAWIAFALAAGAGLALQGPVNAQLRADLDAPVTAGAFSFLVATAAMGLVLTIWQLATRAPRPQSPIGSMPWWGWAGAFVGASYVTIVPLLIVEIGVAATIGLTVVGQQLASLVVDRFGLLRLPRRPLTTERKLGVILLLAGVTLIQAI